jgi:hypothetical protein
MDSVLDGMPEMTRKWNGISQHTFSFEGAEPRKESRWAEKDWPPAPVKNILEVQSAEADMHFTGDNCHIQTLQGKLSPLTSEAESEDTEPWDEDLTPDTYEYDSEGPPPLQSESDTDEEYVVDDGEYIVEDDKPWYLPDVEEIQRVKYKRKGVRQLLRKDSRSTR